MIRIVLTDKETNKMICYRTVNRLDEADRYAADYSRINNIKVEVLQDGNVIKW